MRSMMRLWVALTLVLAVGAVALVAAIMVRGLSARAAPLALETLIARQLRRLAMPAHAREAQSPVEVTPELLADARAHFADHCAICHANDGSGDTTIGRGLYPKPPDMRKARTQDLTDGELFYIIHHGVRFTGMPGWGEGDPEEDLDSWKLVAFIRHLPELTPEEQEAMRALSPKMADHHGHGSGHGHDVDRGDHDDEQGEAPDAGSRHSHDGKGNQ